MHASHAAQHMYACMHRAQCTADVQACIARSTPHVCMHASRAAHHICMHASHAAHHMYACTQRTTCMHGYHTAVGPRLSSGSLEATHACMHQCSTRDHVTVCTAHDACSTYVGAQRMPAHTCEHASHAQISIVVGHVEDDM